MASPRGRPSALVTPVRWQIITGEYPPQIGGISDYTRQTALGLAAAGDEVDVWTAPHPGNPPAGNDAGIRVHRLPDHFGRRSLAALDDALRSLPPGERRLLVQFEPWSFGWHGMNVPFCLWLWRRGREWDITVMFHEVCTDWGWRRPFRQNVLGAVTRLNAGLAVRGARRAFVSIPTWATLLRPMAGAAKRIDWLPVPSSLAELPAPERVAALRARLDARWLAGHFGTYRGQVATALAELLPAVVAHGAKVLLVGRGAAEFQRGLDPKVGSRVTAADSLDLAAVAEHLAACDVLVQPYPDGISARRTSSMAGLRLGCAIVTNAGWLTEPFWSGSKAVRLVPTPGAAALAVAVCDLLDHPAEQAALRTTAAAYYAEHFSPGRIIQALRSAR